MTGTTLAPAGEPGLESPQRSTSVRSRFWTRPWFPVVFVIVVYVLVSLIANWDIWTGGVTHSIQTSGGQDPAMELYFLAQTPWLILHGHNPFANNFLNAPMGLNVLDSTSITFLGVLGAPVTLIFGPIATYNVMLNLALAGSALAFYFMARRFIAWWPAAFVGGLVYGFSPFAYAQGLSHLVWTFDAIPPLLILFVDRFFRKKTASPWWSGLAIGACFVVEFYVSAEAFATLVIFTAIGAVVMALYWWRRTPHVDVPRLTRMCVCAVVVGILGVSFGAWSALKGPEHINGPEQTVQSLAGLATDPVGLVVPTLNQHFTFGAANYGDKLVADRSASWQVVFEAPDENGTYVGVTLLIALVAGAVILRRRRIVQFAVLMAVVALVLSMGSHLQFAGHHTGLPLPFDVLTHLPVVKSLTAVRLMEYFWLFAALLLALVVEAVYSALAARDEDRHHWVAWAVSGALVVVVLLPLVPAWPYSSTQADVPAWFTHDARSLPVGTNVVVYPVATALNASAMIWQAEADVTFKMPGGYAIFASPPGGTATFWATSSPLTGALESCAANGTGTLSPSDVRDQLRAWGTRYVVVPSSSPGAPCAEKVFEGALGAPQRHQGVLLWASS
jgi:hypothetical protein